MKTEFEILRRNRKALTKLLGELSLEQINDIPQGHNNNILWNSAHIVSVQEAITYGLSGLRWTASKDIVKHYARGTAPTEARDQGFVDEVIGELLTSIDRLEANYNTGEFEKYQPYTVQTGYEMTSIEDAIKFNIFHEGLHFGYIMSIRGKVK